MDKNLHQPLGGNEMPRFGGIATMMRLPHVQSPPNSTPSMPPSSACPSTSAHLPAPVPASAPRDPRRIGDDPSLQHGHRRRPFDSLNVADIGDVAINTFNLLEAVRIIGEYDRILGHGIPADPLGTPPSPADPLRAIKKKHGKVGLVHVDAHADVNDHMFGEKIAHGTTFRRARWKKTCLDCDRVAQIGLRAQGYTAEDFNWSRKQAPRGAGRGVLAQVAGAADGRGPREVGGGPVYLSFDIDGIDPAWAPGTGTPEIGGLTTIQAMEIIRGCQA